LLAPCSTTACASSAFRSASATPDGGYKYKTTWISYLGLTLSFCTLSTGQPHLHPFECLPLQLLVGHGDWLWLHSEKLSEQNPVGFDSPKRFAEVHKDGNMEYAVGIKIQVLDVVVPE
jgi:hypothetical protein